MHKTTLTSTNRHQDALLHPKYFASLSWAKILERIASDELRDKTFNMFRAVRDKNLKSSLTRLQVPSSWPTQNGPTNDEWADSKTWDKETKPFHEVTLPDELEYYLVQRNR
jgi:hypothetical protein